MKKRTKILLATLAMIFLAVLIGGYAYLSDYYHANDFSIEATAVQEDGVPVEQDGSVTWFLPSQPTAGLIFYPGGKVEDTAYAPLMRALAEKGILCGLVKMPGNLAVLSPNAADGLRQVHPVITDWYIGGHSLGGAMRPRKGTVPPPSPTRNRFSKLQRAFQNLSTIPHSESGGASFLRGSACVLRSVSIT